MTLMTYTPANLYVHYSKKNVENVARLKKLYYLCSQISKMFR